MRNDIKPGADRHEFALFVPSLSSFVQSVPVGGQFILADEYSVNRIKTIVRLKVGEGCIFFDPTMIIQCAIVEFIGKKQVRCVINDKQRPQALHPTITFLLPLLKRDDFELALYSLVEVGVTTIQLLFTNKSRSAWDSQKDLERAQRIVIAAAEQSKNFAYPIIKEPISLAVGAALPANVKIFFDPSGKTVLECIEQLRINSQKNIMVLIGPEGDLTVQEKEIIIDHGFVFCSLTPTVLRSAQAAALSAGLLRSLLR